MTQHPECRRWKRFCVCMFSWCIHPVFPSARRRPAAVPQSAACRKKTKKVNEKAKIHVGARMVIRRQKAAAGSLLNISYQRASHQRCQRLPELFEDAPEAFWQDTGKNNTAYQKTRHKVALFWLKLSLTLRHLASGTITRHSLMRFGAVKQPSATCYQKCAKPSWKLRRIKCLPFLWRLRCGEPLSKSLKTSGMLLMRWELWMRSILPSASHPTQVDAHYRSI